MTILYCCACRHDVDGAVWRIQEGAMEHVINFPALGYVQVAILYSSVMSLCVLFVHFVCSSLNVL